MALPWTNEPPNERTPYVVPQMEGERLTIPGSKGSSRIVASSKQTAGVMSLFLGSAVVADAPGFHWHQEAHDIFMCTKGFLKVWNGDKCRILGLGDFASVPPHTIHSFKTLGPYTESVGLVAPGDWIDFFRHIGETYNGVVAPEFDNRDLKTHIIGRMMKANKDYDVHFVHDYKPPEVGEWDDEDTKVPEGLTPYYLRWNTGPRWMAGSVMSRPFCTTANSGGRFAISSLESSKDYGKTILDRYMTFPKTDHCFVVMEGVLIVKMKGGEEHNVHDGETAVLPANHGFALGFGSKYVRVNSFASGDGIEAIIHRAGEPYEGIIIPDSPPTLDATKWESVCKDLGVILE